MPNREKQISQVGIAPKMGQVNGFMVNEPMKPGYEKMNDDKI